VKSNVVSHPLNATFNPAAELQCKKDQGNLPIETIPRDRRMTASCCADHSPNYPN
jgi:hypothetical protein